MNRLSDFHIKKIDLVGLAANKRSITLFKSQTGDPMTKKLDLSKLPDDMQEIVKSLAAIAQAKQINIEDVPADQREAVTALLKAAGVEVADPENPKDKKKAADTKDGDTGLDDEQLADVLKAITAKLSPPKSDDGLDGVDEATAAAIRRMEKSIDEGRAETKKALERAEAAEKALAEVTGREQRQKHIAMAKALDDLPGVNPDDFGDVLAQVEAKAGPDVFKKLNEVLKSSAAVMRENALLVEFGHGLDDLPEDTPMGEVNKLAKALIEKNPEMTMPQARSAVYKARPELYQKIVGEERQRVIKARGGLAIDVE